MSTLQEALIAARKASGLTVQEAADLVKLSRPGYIGREREPEQFRISELQKLHKGLNDISRPILEKAVSEIFLSE